MPRRDGTGPNGEGPMTGKAMGNCNGENNQSGFGRGRRCGGRGKGNGMGRGWRSAGRQGKTTGDM
ncbi:MAG: hypothetical protein PWP51_626 [Clostridiales bacterium]|nr:hypothetical protein [Clostridiales bacterium]MDN5298073.1 hypothetical protein [Clostridiales bacterium]